jgi:hypothetical protein
VQTLLLQAIELKLKSGQLECSQGRLLNFDRGYRFFLKVAFVFLVASIFLPFAYETLIIRPILQIRSFYWSFIRVGVSDVVSPDAPLDQSSVSTWWLFPPRYWVTYEARSPSDRSSILLGSMFALQITVVLLGVFAVTQARRAWSLMPFFLGILALDALTWYAATAYYRPLSFGFWVLVVATLFISIALIRAKNWV